MMQKKELVAGNYRQVIELLGKALYVLFKENSALRAMPVGISRAKDAIKLATFGVHANNFLSLQEFLPQVTQDSNGGFLVEWKQEDFGHPGNWRENSASFCMKTFLDLILKIQDADWIPGAISFSSIYEYKIEAIKDGVEIWRENREGGFSLSPPGKGSNKSLKKRRIPSGHGSSRNKSTLISTSN